MSRKEPVRLLILEESENRAEEIVVLLRTAGLATRAHRIESPTDLLKKLKEQSWDLLLACNEASGLTAEDAIKQVDSLEKDVPMILLADNRELESITKGMKLGAKDVVLEDDDERFLLIVERELGNLDVRRQMGKAEAERRDTDIRNQLLLNSSAAAIGYVHEGMHVYTNKAYIELFGYEDADEFAGIPIIDLISSSDQGKFKTFLKTYENEGSPNKEFTCVDSKGEAIRCVLTTSPATYDGEVCTQIIFRTGTDDSEMEDRIKEISSQDLLTGLFNRQYFIDRLATAINDASSGEDSSIVFYIAIDNFTQVRSDAGISNADLVLGGVASLVRGFVDDEHLIARFGDDVFCLLFQSGDKDRATELAEGIRAKVEDHLLEVSGKSYQLTIRIGLSLVSKNAPSKEEIISRAHLAADAIEDGNGVLFYKAAPAAKSDIEVPAEDGEAEPEDSVQSLVNQAVENNLLKLSFQPIISLHGEDDQQFEVLLRLLDESQNELLPHQFFDAAEEAGLLEKFDRWVILESIKDLSKQRETGSKARLFINITHKSMSDDSFLPWMSVALKAAKLPSDAIIFQIHEKDASTYMKQASAFAEGLAKIHCKTSVNHFGNSLTPAKLLKHLTPDFVNLDASYAKQLEKGNEEEKEALYEMVNELQMAGVLTVMAGVESPSILPNLWEAGVNFIQGYYISPPLDELVYDFSDEDI
jgi:diguanylate cyclase (GGDEF)-like protein/PAS domain S-box-containing protein